MVYENKRDMKKIKEGLIEYVNYRLDQFEDGTYLDPDKLLFNNLKSFYEHEVIALLINSHKNELTDLIERFEVLG